MVLVGRFCRSQENFDVWQVTGRQVEFDRITSPILTSPRRSQTTGFESKGDRGSSHQLFSYTPLHKMTRMPYRF